MAAGGVGASSGGRLGADGADEASRTFFNVFRRFCASFCVDFVVFPVFPVVPSAPILVPRLEVITHVTQVSKSCNHFCEEGTTLLVHGVTAHENNPN